MGFFVDRHEALHEIADLTRQHALWGAAQFENHVNISRALDRGLITRSDVAEAAGQLPETPDALAELVKMWDSLDVERDMRLEDLRNGEPLKDDIRYFAEWFLEALPKLRQLTGIPEPERHH